MFANGIVVVFKHLCKLPIYLFTDSGVTEKQLDDPAASATSVLAAAASVVPARLSKDDEPTSEWCSTATLAEQIRERNMDDTEARSLTERLRKEFGLENLDDSDTNGMLDILPKCCNIVALEILFSLKPIEVKYFHFDITTSG